MAVHGFFSGRDGFFVGSARIAGDVFVALVAGGGSDEERDGIRAVDFDFAAISRCLAALRDHANARLEFQRALDSVGIAVDASHDESVRRVALTVAFCGVSIAAVKLILPGWLAVR